MDNEVLRQLEDLWNNYPAVGNTLSLLSPIITIVFGKLLLNAKKKISELLASNKKKVPEEKIDLLIENQIKSDRNVQNLNRMILMFALKTNVEGKEELIDIYQNIKSNAIEVSEKVQEIIETTIEQSKELVEDVKVKAEETRKEAKTIINKYIDELNNE